MTAFNLKLDLSFIRASLVAQLVKNLPAMQETLVRFLGRKIPCRRDRLPSPVFSGFSSGSSGKESTCNARNLSLFPGLERSLGKGNSYQLQYFGLENSMDCIVHEVTKSGHNWVTFTFPRKMKFIICVWYDYKVRKFKKATKVLKPIKGCLDIR